MEIAVKELVRRFGKFTAVDGINFTIASGECLALLGPSGCGKTTTLNIVAGFQQPDAGEVLINGSSIIGIAPYRRNTGMVFQNYALFPHMTVFDNVAYGLRQRKASSDAIKSDVPRALELVQLGHLDARYPRELSGGQQQRVALARAIVFKPDILLLDEPLSNLDAKLRESMRLELKEIQKVTGVTTIFVTHDQAEAMVLADHVAVMNRGRIEQIAAPQLVYDRPATAFVADFVGSANFMEGVLAGYESGIATVKLPATATLAKVASPDMSGYPKGELCKFMIRPERLHVATAPSRDHNEVEATVKTIAFTGSMVDCYCDVSGQPMHAQIISGRQSIHPGQTVWLSWQASEAYLLRSEP